MKKYFKTLILASLLLFVSCYSDKGNYDYDPVKMEVKGLSSSYSPLKGDTISIAMQVFPENADYEYVWGIYKKILVEQGVPKLDTISNTKDLNWICDVTPGTYPLVFTARNKQTGVCKTEYATLSVITKNSNGWYILKDSEGFTDFDMYYEDGAGPGGAMKYGSIPNWIASYNGGKNLKGKAVSVCFSFDYMIEEGKPGLAILPVSSEDVALVGVSTGHILKDMSQLFYDVPANPKFENCCGENSKWIIFNNGKVHSMEVNTDGKFIVPAAGNYRVSPNRTYQSGGRAILFDDISKSFLYYDGSGSPLVRYANEQPGDNPPLLPSDMNADLLSMHKFGVEDADRVKVCALMKKNGSEEGMILKLAECMSDINPIFKVYNVPADKFICKGGKWTANLMDFIIYFVYNGKIYSHNIESGEERMELDLVGEDVTYMEHVVFEDFAAMKMHSHFVIATKTGKNYKVYRHTIGAGGRLSEDPVLPVFEGVGSVAKVLQVGQGGCSMLF